MDDLDKLKMYDMANRARELTEKEIDIKKNAAAAAKEIQAARAQEAEKTKTESKATQMRAVDDMVKKLATKSLARFLKGDDETSEAALDALNKASQETPWEDMTPDQRAFAVVSANTLVKLQPRLLAQEKRIKELETSLAAYSSGGPNTGKAAPVVTSPDKGLSFLDAIAGAIK